MAKRGTTLTLSNPVGVYATTGLTRKRWYPWQDFVGAAATTVLAGAGAGAPTSAAAIGESGKTIGISGLECGADNDEFALYIPNLDDVDLSQPIYFDFHTYFEAGFTAGEGITWAGTAIPFDPARATAALISDDEDSITLLGTSTIALADTDADNIRIQTGLYVPAASIDSNDKGIIPIFTVTLNGSLAATEAVLVGVMMRFTSKY